MGWKDTIQDDHGSTSSWQNTIQNVAPPPPMNDLDDMIRNKMHDPGMADFQKQLNQELSPNNIGPKLAMAVPGTGQAISGVTNGIGSLANKIVENPSSLDIIGLLSPRAAHAIKMASKLGPVAEKIAKRTTASAPIIEEAAPSSDAVKELVKKRVYDPFKKQYTGGL